MEAKPKPADQAQRDTFLRSVGIDPANQHLAVNALKELQRAAVVQADKAIVLYLRRWVPELKGIRPKHFMKRLGELDAVFSALFMHKEPLKGTNSLTYGLARKHRDGSVEKKAFEMTYQIVPIIKGPGIFQLNVDHKEIPFPANVKVLGV